MGFQRPLSTTLPLAMRHAPQSAAQFRPRNEIYRRQLYDENASRAQVEKRVCGQCAVIKFEYSSHVYMTLDKAGFGHESQAIGKPLSQHCTKIDLVCRIGATAPESA